jgi:hypothetical protein
LISSSLCEDGIDEEEIEEFNSWILRSKDVFGQYYGVDTDKDKSDDNAENFIEIDEDYYN